MPGLFLSEHLSVVLGWDVTKDTLTTGTLGLPFGSLFCYNYRVNQTNQMRSAVAIVVGGFAFGWVCGYVNQNYFVAPNQGSLPVLTAPSVK